MSNQIQSKTNQEWKNWAKNLVAKPQCTFYPKSPDDLIAIVKQAKANQKKIRVVGSSHSWSPLVPTNEYLVMMRGLKNITTNKNDKGCFITTGPGATAGEVIKKAAKANMAFPTDTVVLNIQEGGIVATGCHGMGWNQPTLSDLVYAMDIVLASGEIRTFSVENDGEEVMNQIRVNLGSLGIISSITFKIEDSFNVHNVDEILLMKEVINKDDPSVLKRWVTSPENQYLALFWFPFNQDTLIEEKVQVKHQTRTNKSVNGIKLLFKSIFDFMLPYLEFVFGFIFMISFQRGYPSKTRKILKRLATMAFQKSNSVLPTTEAFHFHKKAGKIIEVSWGKPSTGGKFCSVNFSWALPIDEDFNNVTTAWYQIVEGLYEFADNGKYPAMLIHARFIKNSQALLSPAYQPTGSNTHTCFIEFMGYAPKAHYEEFISFLAQKWMKLGGRPHWPKYFQNVDDIFPYLQQAYGPEFGDTLQKFKAFRDELDPDGLFLNAFVERIFSGK